MKRVLIGLGVLFLFGIVLPAAGFGAYFWTFYRPVPGAEISAPPTNRTEARKQDIDYLARYPEFDRSFTSAEKRAFALKSLRCARTLGGGRMKPTGPKSQPPLLSQKMGTRMFSRSKMLSRYPTLPLRLFWFGDGLFIVRAQEGHGDLLGQRVESIGGVTPATILAKLDRYFGGNEAFLRFESANYFAAAGFLQTIGAIPEGESVTFSLTDPETGAIRDVTIPFAGNPTELVSISYLPLGATADEETAAGVAAWTQLDAAATGATLYGMNPGSNLFAASLPEGGSYLRLRSIWGSSDDGTPFAKWLKQQGDRLRADPVPYLVIDLRSNGGGDLMQARAFAQNVLDYLTDDGRVYILIDGGTFSAAIVTTALFARCGGTAERYYWRATGGLRPVLGGRELHDAAKRESWSGGYDWLSRLGKWLHQLPRLLLVMCCIRRCRRTADAGLFSAVAVLRLCPRHRQRYRGGVASAVNAKGRIGLSLW